MHLRYASWRLRCVRKRFPRGTPLGGTPLTFTPCIDQERQGIHTLKLLGPHSPADMMPSLVPGCPEVKRASSASVGATVKQLCRTMDPANRGLPRGAQRGVVKKRRLPKHKRKQIQKSADQSRQMQANALATLLTKQLRTQTHAHTRIYNSAASNLLGPTCHPFTKNMALEKFRTEELVWFCVEG